ncbi:nuclear transport factor 2 family protein [Umezawaea sp. Da 62-37]|uniref:ester cyclase n=1 Tax=Umezawaea sp. Da 62-37 TaxID=3075927 RepID=UPI0028F73ECD|nr:nuclear transport factor 2 family protein [Umezawaea sp. Da 62-37]WNV89000.1 nuclear transport factor 2 family protein [Umezawaea sp. Da 62-37]
MSSLGEKFVVAWATQDWDALAELYDEDVILYAPFAWKVAGRATILKVAVQFHLTYPGLRAALHDEFHNADNTRAVFRYSWDWHNTGPFYGQPATDERGTTIETHTVRLRDGRITEQIVSTNNLALISLQLGRGVEFPLVTPDPALAIVSAAG